MAVPATLTMSFLWVTDSQLILYIAINSSKAGGTQSDANCQVYMSHKTYNWNPNSRFHRCDLPLFSCARKVKNVVKDTIFCLENHCFVV
jgi:hypothetical protein